MWVHLLLFGIYSDTYVRRTMRVVNEERVGSLGYVSDWRMRSPANSSNSSSTPYEKWQEGGAPG